MAQDEGAVVVHLQTNLPEALVYSDSVFLGQADLRVFSLEKSQSEIRLVAPSIDSWSIPSVGTHIDASPGDTIQVKLDFSYYYQIESVPFDARVFLEQPDTRTLLGSTPLKYTSDKPLKGMLLVSSEGYESVRFSPGEEIWNYHRTVMTREEEIEESIAEGYWKPDRKTGPWLELIAGSVALASGIAAIRFKAKADRRYDRYALSGDPTLRPGFERYDRYAAVSLGAMQVGIGVLAIRMVID